MTVCYQHPAQRRWVAAGERRGTRAKSPFVLPIRLILRNEALLAVAVQSSVQSL
jgi:hypothetical protein